MGAPYIYAMRRVHYFMRERFLHPLLLSSHTNFNPLHLAGLEILHPKNYQHSKTNNNPKNTTTNTNVINYILKINKTHKITLQLYLAILNENTHTPKLAVHFGEPAATVWMCVRPEYRNIARCVGVGVVGLAWIYLNPQLHRFGREQRSKKSWKPVYPIRILFSNKKNSPTYCGLFSSRLVGRWCARWGFAVWALLHLGLDACARKTPFW